MFMFQNKTWFEKKRRYIYTMKYCINENKANVIIFNSVQLRILSNYCVLSLLIGSRSVIIDE